MVNDPDSLFNIPWATKAVLIDEISMVSDWMLDRLTAAVGPATTIVGIGDRAQLPPVGRDMNALFSGADLTLGLSRVMRHEGPILRLSDDIRRCKEDLPLIETNTGGSAPFRSAVVFTSNGSGRPPCALLQRRDRTSCGSELQYRR